MAACCHHDAAAVASTPFFATTCCNMGLLRTAKVDDVISVVTDMAEGGQSTYGQHVLAHACWLFVGVRPKYCYLSSSWQLISSLSVLQVLTPPSSVNHVSVFSFFAD
jgi:hypothetical protein